MGGAKGHIKVLSSTYCKIKGNQSLKALKLKHFKSILGSYCQYNTYSGFSARPHWLGVIGPNYHSVIFTATQAVFSTTL